MNILFISKDLAGADLCYRLKLEGHNVRIFIENKNQRQNLSGLVDKTEDWKNNLDWVGKSGLIIFDDMGYGETQDTLRSKGFSVVGGSKMADKLEHDRQYGHKIFSTCGLKIVPTINFSNARSAIKFVKENKGPWVIKQNGHASKGFNYVGQLKNGEDVILVLKNYNRNNKKECVSIDLQKRIDGVEIGVARYFNGSDWVGPIEINIEHKNLCDNDLGPKTDEMGTLMWYEDNEEIKIFQETLKKLESYLKHINFKGDIDINCIVNKNSIFPLEATPRFGCPSTQLQSEIHISPWGEFLKAIAKGEQYDLKYKKGFAIITLLATPPFPYEIKTRKYYPEGVDILFRKRMSAEDMKHLHFEEISFDKKTRNFYISSKKGYILHVSNIGKTVKEAREKTYKIVNNIVIPKMFYRTDIGLKFIQEDQEKLRSWGWI
ncbi:MAG: phosphoribosylglycinamide synthetase C domain-containing protein [bacterium]|nr:phosphoribosylglycinamide synthetase C domain-containing protein [bacterium]